MSKVNISGQTVYVDDSGKLAVEGTFGPNALLVDDESVVIPLDKDGKTQIALVEDTQYYVRPKNEVLQRMFNWRPKRVAEVTLSWDSPTVSGAVPTERAFHTATLVDNTVYMFGGLRSNGECSNQLYQLELDSYTWSRCEQSGSIPSPRHSHSATLIGSKIYVFGGQNEKGVVADSFIYVLDVSADSLEWEIIETEETNVTARFGHVAALQEDHGIIIFHGGMSTVEETNVELDNIEMFDTNEGKWVDMKDIKISGAAPGAVAYHSANLVDEFLYVYGGQSKALFGHSYNNNVSILNTKTMEWSGPYESIFDETAQHSACVFRGNVIVVFGGLNSWGYDGSLSFYNTSKSQWNRVYDVEGTPSLPRSAHSACITADNKVVFIGGTGDDGHLLKNVSVVDLNSVDKFMTKQDAADAEAASN